MVGRPTARVGLDRNAVLLVVVGLVLGGLYFAAIDLRDPDGTFAVHERIIAGTAGSPYRYRVLVPLILETLTRAFSIVEPRAIAFVHASALYDCLGLVGQLLALYALIRQWFPPIQALVGVSFTSAVTVATFSYFTYQPWSIMEVTFFALGLLFAYRNRQNWVGAMVLLASLNRETGVFLPLAVLLASLVGWRLFANARRAEVRLAFAYLVLSASIFAGLRLIRGSADQVDPLPDVIARNLLPDNLLAGAMVVTLFLGIGWVYVPLGLSRAPDFIRRVARVIPFYLLAFAIWGWWREVRILTTLYPIVIPLILSFCYRRGTSSDERWALENSNL